MTSVDILAHRANVDGLKSQNHGIMTLEVIIPTRNPTEVLNQTVESLAAQTDKNFSVLISDNCSTKGLELIDRAVERLQAAGIATRKIRPPFELGRVEHQNWINWQSQADWIKPLYTGDWVSPNCAARFRAEIEANPECHYIFASYELHLANAAPTVVCSPWAAGLIRRRKCNPGC